MNDPFPEESPRLGYDAAVVELTETQADVVAGGINPQPLPPRWSLRFEA